MQVPTASAWRPCKVSVAGIPIVGSLKIRGQVACNTPAVKCLLTRKRPKKVRNRQTRVHQNVLTEDSWDPRHQNSLCLGGRVSVPATKVLLSTRESRGDLLGCCSHKARGTGCYGGSVHSGHVHRALAFPLGKTGECNWGPQAERECAGDTSQSSAVAQRRPVCFDL